MSSEINKKTDIFLEEFNRLKSTVKHELEDIRPSIDTGEGKGDAKEELKVAIGDIEQNLLRMKNLLAEGALFLPSYTLKSAQDSFNQLTKDFQQKHDELIPRKKFTFGQKTRPLDTELTQVFKKQSEDAIDFVKSQSLENRADPTKSVEFKNNRSKSVRNFKEEKIDVTGKEVTIVDMVDCDIEIQGSPKTVYVNRLINCTLKLGPVSASVMVHDCEGTQFYFAAQQLRIHNTKKSVFFIHVSSRCIIEDCDGLKFGRYKLWYDNISEDFAKAELDMDKNNWQCIDDFNWPSKGLKSPNYDLLTESNQ